MKIYKLKNFSKLVSFFRWEVKKILNNLIINFMDLKFLHIDKIIKKKIMNKYYKNFFFIKIYYFLALK